MASMDYDTYKELEQNLAEATDWSEEVTFDVERDGKDVYLTAQFFVEDDDGVMREDGLPDKYKLVKVED